MKGLSIILAAFSVGAAPIQNPATALPVVDERTAERVQKSGRESVAAVRKAYESGEYDQFFKEMDDSYESAKERGELTQLAQMRSGFSPEWQDWESRAQKLQDEKNKELLNAIAGQKKTPFVEKVHSVTANLSNEAQQKAIAQMTACRQMAPGTGQNADVNRLIDLDLEYEYKFLNLDLPDASPLEKREKLCALKMQKLAKMLEASKEFQDKSLKKQTATYSENFDERLAQSWDVADLNALAHGKTMPMDASEEKIGSILSLYQEKFSAMTQALIDEHEKK